MSSNRGGLPKDSALAKLTFLEKNLQDFFTKILCFFASKFSCEIIFFTIFQVPNAIKQLIFTAAKIYRTFLSVEQLERMIIQPVCCTNNLETRVPVLVPCILKRYQKRGNKVSFFD